VIRAATASGFFGKLPRQGDFVAAGLPRRTIAVFDAWAARIVPGTQAMMGRFNWTQAWQTAPVWRFAVPDEAHSDAGVIGVWMPSVDQVGRYFPLMIAATCPEATPEQMVRRGTAWLDAADDAGRAAIADSLTPAQLTMLIPPSPDLLVAQESTPPHGLQPRPGLGCWWTEGAPLVPAQGRVLDAMPDAATFVTMLDADWRERE